MKSICISLGGSLIAGEKGFNAKYVSALAGFVKSKKDIDFIIICGAGYYCRSLLKSARAAGVSNNIELDRIGIEVTRLNAYMVKEVFKANGVNVVPYVPRTTDELRGFIGKYQVIVSGGFVEGVTTDTDAALAAEAAACKLLVNASQLSFVYDRDPKRYKDAEKQKHLSFQELIRISGENDRRAPGSNVIFDSFAAKIVARSQIAVKFVGSDIKALENVVEGKPHDGTSVG